VFEKGKIKKYPEFGYVLEGQNYSKCRIEAVFCGEIGHNNLCWNVKVCLLSFYSVIFAS
jgi:hypothetical protein